MATKSFGFVASLVACSFAICPAFAQDAPAAEQEAPPLQRPSAPAADDAQNLAKQLANPIASLISVPFQNNYDFGLGPDGDGYQYKLNVQPVIPITLNDEWNLISRTIVPLIGQEGVVPSPPSEDGTQVGLGDTVQSFFFSPQKPTSGGIIWGVGPVFLLPTATSDFTGSGKWGIGPTVVALKQTGPWTVGALANHIWSVAGDDDRNGVSATFLQPFIGYTTPKAMTFTINSESTYDWKNGQWTVPVNFLVAQLFKPSATALPFPVQVQIGYRRYLEAAPNGPKDGFRLNFVALFPRN